MSADPDSPGVTVALEGVEGAVGETCSLNLRVEPGYVLVDARRAECDNAAHVLVLSAAEASEASQRIRIAASGGQLNTPTTGPQKSGVVIDWNIDGDGGSGGVSIDWAPEFLGVEDLAIWEAGGWPDEAACGSLYLSGDLSVRESELATFERALSEGAHLADEWAAGRASPQSVGLALSAFGPVVDVDAADGVTPASPPQASDPVDDAGLGTNGSASWKVLSPSELADQLAAASSSNDSQELLELSRSPNWEVRRAVALNPAAEQARALLRDDRVPMVREVVEQLEAGRSLASLQMDVDRSRASAPSVADHSHPSAVAASSSGERRRGRGRTVLVLAAVGVLLLGGVIAWRVIGDQNKGPSARQVCVEYQRFIWDAQQGVFTDPELRTAIQSVRATADGAQSAATRMSLALGEMLAAVTGGFDQQSARHAMDVMDAECTRVGMPILG